MNRDVESIEADLILGRLVEVMPKQIDGRSAIVKMKDAGSSNWRQMEWIGFWFEHFVQHELTTTVGFSVGPTFGRTRFDIAIDHVWDLKVHPQNSNSTKLILNDQEAVDLCIKSNGGFGFIVVLGNAEYDDSGKFKSWHDAFKGGRSAYEAERIERGALSRRRKVAFHPTSIEAFFLRNDAVIQNGLNQGWLTLFQTGMRNSNGVPRRPKYQIDLSKSPPEVLLTRAIL